MSTWQLAHTGSDSCCAKRSRVDPLFLGRLAAFLVRHRRARVLSFGYTANLWTRLASVPGLVPPSISCVRDLTYLPRATGVVGRGLATLESSLSRRSRWIVANSGAPVTSLVARGFIPPAKMLAIPNAVEGQAFASRAEALSSGRLISSSSFCTTATAWR